MQGYQPRVSCPAGHCRFATSSIPTPAESHPHQWTPSVKSTVWLPCNMQHLPGPLVPASRPGDSRNLRACKDSGGEVGGKPAPEAEERQRWQLQPVSRPHGIFVTHNGDFECYELFGRKKTCAEVMAWLSAVLHVPAPADCDSVAIAGSFLHACVHACICDCMCWWVRGCLHVRSHFVLCSDVYHVALPCGSATCSISQLIAGVKHLTTPKSM